MSGPNPVSYTHLDVYKRQAEPRGRPVVAQPHDRPAAARRLEGVGRRHREGALARRHREDPLRLELDDLIGVRERPAEEARVEAHPAPERDGARGQHLDLGDIGVPPVSYTHLDVYKRQD